MGLSHFRNSALTLSLILLFCLPAPARLAKSIWTSDPAVVISEFRTRGPNGGNDEFIELYNRSADAVDIGGWRLKGSNGTGVASARVTISTSTILPARGHFLAVNQNSSGGYSGAVPGDQGYTMGITDDGGIALTYADDTIVDQVGMSGGSMFREGAPLAPTPANQNQSYERKPGGELGSGTDSDDNAADFIFHAGSCGPKNLHSAPVPPVDHPSGTGMAVPALASAGDIVLLTVQVAPALSPTSTGLSVTGDLRPIGGSSAQVFADDGAPGDASAGDGIFSFQAVIGTDTTTGLKRLPVMIVDVQGRSGGAVIALEVTGGCSSTYTAIFTIQGSTAASPLAGTTVDTEGLVVGNFQGASGLSGIFLQDPSGDGDPSTSDGIFVYLPAANPLSGIAVTSGERLRVRGTVNEYNQQTEISQVTDLRRCGAGAVAPIALTLPAPAPGDLERYEGMLVVCPQALTISENTWLDRYGQLTLSAAGRMYAPTNGQGDTDGLNARRMLAIDDGSLFTYPNPIPYLGTDAVLRAGDTITGLTGVLDQGLTGAGNGYRLQPVVTVTLERNNPRSPAPPALLGNLKVASFNLDNYFITLRSRGASSPAELDRQRRKIVAALLAIDADIAGLVEVENSPAALDDLVSALNQATAPGRYARVTAPAPGTDLIQVALIYQPARVTPVGPPLNYQVSSGNDAPLFDRPPLAQAFRLPSNGATLTVVVNHFKSKGCDGAAGADLDQGDGQGCWNARRVMQARALLDFASSLKPGVGNSNILFMGDLNAYGEEDPIRILTGSGLTSEVSAHVPLAGRYSYIFNGQSGTLDHAFTTPSLHALVTGAAFWHINADEPSAIDYHLGYKFPDLYQPDPFRSSDHDPLIITLNLNSSVYLPVIVK